MSSKSQRTRGGGGGGKSDTKGKGQNDPKLATLPNQEPPKRPRRKRGATMEYPTNMWGFDELPVDFRK